MSFTDLDPFEKVAAVERHLAQLEPLPGTPRFDVPTLEAMRRVKLAFADDRVSDEELGEIAADWTEHLGSLDPHDADAARFELRRFAEILDGLRGPEMEEDEPEA